MLVYLFGIFLGWRILSVLGILSCGALIPGLFFIPESPRWLAKMGKLEEAELSLLVLRGFSSDITIEMEEIKCMVIGFSLGLGLVPWLIMSEILPVNIKGLGGSAATMANFLMSWVVTLIANMMLAWNA